MKRIEVVRIEAGGSRGAGFRIARDRVVTALHVIGIVDRGDLTLHGTIRVKGVGCVEVIESTEDIVFDRELDWACLRVDATAFKGVTVLAIGDRVETHDRWAAYGFPDTAPDDGKATAGTITSTGTSVRFGSVLQDVYQLYSLEAGAGLGGAVRGYSGAPVVVAGHAVAMLSAGVVKGTVSVEGTLYAVPLAPIAAKLGIPLAGIPQLPDEIGYPVAPFRGLHRYRREDARLLFGRDREIREIVGGGRGVMLVTGQAGAGKSSVLEAGALPRLETLYSCRLARVEGGDLRGAWRKATGGDWLAEEAECRGPLLVMIDQLEDGTAELEAWIREDLAVCLSGGSWRPQGRLILSFRKEWAIEIEQALAANGVPDWTTVLLSPLKRAEIVEVVEGVGQLPRYKTSVESGLGARIADALLADPDAPRAPTLQVWLTELHARQPRHLTCSDFDRLLRDGASLADFLDRQLATVPPAAFESGLALDLLAFHVGPLGTSASLSTADLDTAYAHIENRAEIIAALASASLLVPLDGGVGHRLIHDTLGPVVLARAAASDTPAQRARMILDGQRVEWRRGPKVDDIRGRLAPLLDTHRLDIVIAGRVAMRALDPEDESLVRASIAARRADEAHRHGTNAVRAISALLDESADTASPAADCIAHTLAEARYLLPLGRQKPAGLATSGDGGTLAFSYRNGELWIVPTAFPRLAHSLPGIAAARTMSASYDGAWIALASRTELCVVEAQTGVKHTFECEGSAEIEIFATRDGHVFHATRHQITGFAPGSTRPRWSCQRETAERTIRNLRATTHDPPYLVCELQAADSTRAIAWLDTDGQLGSLRCADPAAVAIHPFAGQIALADDDTVSRIELATGVELLRLSIARLVAGNVVFGKPAVIVALSPAHLLVAIKMAQVRELNGFVEVSRDGIAAARLDTEEPPRSLASSDEIFFSTASRVAWVDGRRSHAVDVGPTLEKRPFLLSGRDGLVFAHNKRRLRALDICKQLSTEVATMSSAALSLAPRGTGSMIAATRPFLLDVELRGWREPREVAHHDDDVRAAHVDASGIVTCGSDGSIALHGTPPRHLGVITLEDGEGVTGLTRAASTWFAITNHGRIHGVPTDGAPSLSSDISGTAQSFHIHASPDGLWLLAYSGPPNAGSPALYSLGPGPRVRRPITLTELEVTRRLRFAFSLDGRWLAASDPRGVAIWDLHERSQPRRLYDAGGPSHASALGFRPDHRLVIVWPRGHLVTVDPATGAVLDSAPTLPGPDFGARLSPDARWCLGQGDDYWLVSTDDYTRRTYLANLPFGEPPVAIDNRARWFLTEEVKRHTLHPIAPFGPLVPPIDLGEIKWHWLAPDGSQIVTVDDLGLITRIRLDATRALHEQLVLP